MSFLSSLIEQETLSELDFPAPQLEVSEERLVCKSGNEEESRIYWNLAVDDFSWIFGAHKHFFLGDNEILPLPCVTTVRKYLATIHVENVDSMRSILQRSIKRMPSRDSFQCRGITYTGFQDLGDEPDRSQKLDDYGLVFSFRSFGGKYQQPAPCLPARCRQRG